MRTTGVQRRDVLALGVQRVRGDHHTGQIDAGRGVEQRDEPVDLAGLAIHGDLPEHDPGVLVGHREQMRPRHLHAVTTDVSGAAQGLAVHREHTAPPGRSGPGAQPLHERADRGVEPVGVDLPEQAADGRLRRAPPIGAQHRGDLVGQVGDPLGDRDERPGSGRDRAHGHSEHDDQAVPDPAPPTGIRHPVQRFAQVGSEKDRIG